SLAANTPWDGEAWTKEIQVWEDTWTHATGSYPTTPEGESVDISLHLLEKYAGS
ncbi:MAG: alpha-N-acetylglucosaminidase C-terminal domain-containing protein, partial [Candidatus Hydrogenedentes bacterium]|nr:alpha-N-acetylglucosaminidase C-terminal domain-containing protein [Candidatus Hydrogenedentota bacterium]